MNNKIRNNFPWLKVHKNLIYFDSAATTLKPKCVIDAINNYYINYGTNTHNSDSSFAYKTTMKINQIRQKTAKLFNTTSKNIIFNSSATESLNTVVNGLSYILKPNDEVLISKLEHASNLLPWIVYSKQNKFKLKFIKQNKIPIANDFIKEITPKTKVISFATESNILGNIIDYDYLTRKAKSINNGIIVIMDVAQYLPHHKIITNNDIDFVCGSAHKLLGPTGLGILYMSSKWINKLSPFKYGGGMNETFNENKYKLTSDFTKFEGGTLPLAQIFGFGAAIDYLNKIGWKKINKYLLELKKYFIQQLNALNNIIIYNKNEPLPIIFFNIKNIHAQDLTNWLGKKGIICRAGLSCAKLANRIIHTTAAVRLSLYFYNTKDEINKFISIMKKFKKGDEIII